MFLVTVLIMNTAKTKKALNSAIFEVQSIAQQRNCPLRRLDYQLEDGLMASVPIGINNIGIQRALTIQTQLFLCRLPRRSFFRTALKPSIAVLMHFQTI